MIDILLAIEEIGRDSERERIEELYRLYAQRVKWLAFGILKNEADAEDALIDVFMKIIRYREKFLSAEEDETVRLLVIYTRSVCFDLLRKKGRLEMLSLTAKDDGPAETDIPDEVDIPGEIVRRETAQFVRQAIREMGEPASLIVTMKYFHDMKNTEIADMLGLNPSTVGTILQRSLKKLRKKLEVVLDGKNP